MVKFGGKIGTLYQMLKNAFKKYPPQNRTNVQIKGGGVKGLLNNVQKNCTFLKRWHPLGVKALQCSQSKPIQKNTLANKFVKYCTIFTPFCETI